MMVCRDATDPRLEIPRPCTPAAPCSEWYLAANGSAAPYEISWWAETGRFLYGAWFFAGVLPPPRPEFHTSLER